MAQRKRKRRKMTKTQRYERLRTGLRYFGIELKAYKKVTSKALKNAEKAYQEVRKELRKEGITDLPNIVQLAKEVKRREALPKVEPVPIPQAETREPLPYAGEDEAPYIDFSSNILDAFLETMNEAMSEAAAIYGAVPQIWNVMSEQHSKIIATFNQLKAEMGEENLATYIQQSLEYDAVVTTIKASYNEAVEVLDNILTNLEGILSEAKAYNESPQEQWIAPTNITLG